jgi:hypothetical protein
LNRSGHGRRVAATADGQCPGSASASESLVLELLRAIRGDIARLSDRIDEHGHRLSRIEIMMAGLRRDQANGAEARAEREVRVDRLRERVERVERRLDMAPAE